MKEQEGTVPKKIVDLLQSAQSAPNIYSNGFTVGLGTGDITIILTLEHQAIARLNMSYTLAKTLSLKLMDVIKVLESKTGTSIMTTDHINKSLFEAKEGEKK